MFSTWSRQVPSFREPVTPPNVDPDNSGSLVCVRIAAEWLPYVAGALSQLRQDSTWTGTDSERFLAIQRATDLIGILSAAESDGCAMPFDIRFKPTDVCILQKSTDAGTTWTDVGSLADCFTANFGPAIAADIASGVLVGNGSDPRTQGTPNPPWPTGSVPSGQSGGCLSGANASAYIKQLVDNVVAGLNTSANHMAIATTILTGFALIFPIIDVFAVAASALATFLFGIGAAAIEAAMTSTVYDTLKCILQCDVSSDGSCSSTQFANVKSDVSLQIGGVAATIINSILDSIGPNGVTKAGGVAGISSADCSSCDCGWSTKLLGGNGQGALFSFGDFGYYDSGTDTLKGTSYGGGFAIEAHLIVDACEITHVVIHEECDGGGDGIPIHLYLDGTLMGSVHSGTPNPIVLVWDGDNPGVTNIFIQGGNPGSYQTCDYVEIHGKGTKPSQFA